MYFISWNMHEMQQFVCNIILIDRVDIDGADQLAPLHNQRGGNRLSELYEVDEITTRLNSCTLREHLYFLIWNMFES